MDGRWIRSALIGALVSIACGPVVGSSTGSSSSSSSSSSSGGSEGGSASTSDDGVDASNSTGVVSPPPDCSDYMGRATPEQTAMTPQPAAEAELLAMEASGEIVAPLATYERVVAELAAIRAEQPGLVEVVAQPRWSPDAILLLLDEEGMAAYEAGTYHGWDCANALYDVAVIEPGGLFGDHVMVRFDGIYDVHQVIEDYLVLEHILNAEVERWFDTSDVCLAIDGDLYTYIFDDARGDCPAGCTEHIYTGFTAALDGTITELGSFELTDGVPAPAWFEDAEACRTWL